MNDTHPSFRHQCFVSFSKFDTSIQRVLDRTFSKLKFDRSESFLPTYIGLDVDFTQNENLLKATRRFFQHLRKVHQQNFVRFVTDTFWAMESDNSDIFYCHDERKDDRVDIIWSIKALSENQFEVNITNTPNNKRREFLTEFQKNLTNRFTVPTGQDIGENLDSIVQGFYQRAKNINSLQFLREDCHILMAPTPCGMLFRPVLLCGMSPNDAVRRYRAIKSQLQYQRQKHYELFPHANAVGNLMELPLGEMGVYGQCKTKEFNAEKLYCAAEQVYAIYEGAGSVGRSNNDIIILHPEYKPNLNIVTQCHPLRLLAGA